MRYEPVVDGVPGRAILSPSRGAAGTGRSQPREGAAWVPCLLPDVPRASGPLPTVRSVRFRSLRLLLSRSVKRSWMAMVNQRQSVDEIFCAALDLPIGERPAYLEAACDGAPELRALVDELLTEDERAGSFLKVPLLGRTPTPGEGQSRSKEAVLDEGSSSAGDRWVAPRFAAAQVIADRFTVVRFLARGGMGEVYEVEDRLLHGERVALKIIRPEIAEEAGSTERFEQEVLLARKVHHPNLCPIYEIFHCEQPRPAFLFLTMKLLRGDTLDARLRRGRISVRQEAVGICTKLISAVAGIHAAGVVHRDIKPKNVMLEHVGSRVNLFLLDFGLARLHHSDATVLRTGMVAGTPGYLAPELLYGQRPTKASDVFALGVVLHQVLTGEMPLDAGNGVSMVAAPSLLKADGPEFLLEGVREFLADDPEQRCRAFKRVRGGQRAAAPVGIVSEVKPERFTRRRFVVAGTSVAACSVAGGAVWKHDWLRGLMDDLLHPLPRRRFVALLDWPPPAEASVRPMMLGLIDSMAGELARAEAFDHDFYVTAQTVTSEMTTRSQLNQARESLGANLVLAASGRMEAELVHVLLQVVDTVTGRTLRSREVRSSTEEQASLQERTVRAAAEMLDLKRYEPDEGRMRSGTEHAAALAAFQAAEALMKQDNDAGLDAAIVKYREATDADPKYAMAFAKLAIAYGRVYGLRLDSGALHLAKANCEHALELDPRLVSAHIAKTDLLEKTGEEEQALDEIGQALQLDLSNPATLLRQARLFIRLNRWRDAERVFKQALQQRPNLWIIYSDLGFAFHAQGRWREAIDSFRTAATASPRSALAASNLGVEYLQIGDFAAGIASLQRSLALDPHYGDAAANLSLALRYESRFVEALTYARQATMLSPEEDANWLELGDCYSSLHRDEDANKAYLRAAVAGEEHLRTDKTNGPAWMLSALYKVKVGDLSRAAQFLSVADSHFSDDMDSQLYKVRTLEVMGRRDDALDVLRRSFQRGATAFQLAPFPDLNAFRLDPRYVQMAAESDRSKSENKDAST